jgi:hypothetical protein
VAKNEQELLQAVLEARQKVSELDGFLADAKEVKKNAETELVEYMDNHDLKSFKSSVLNCGVVRKETLYVSIEEDKKAEAMRWIEEDCGRGDMIKPTIHNKTLSSFISGRLKEALTIPQELFSYYFKPELSITMSKGGN